MKPKGYVFEELEELSDTGFETAILYLRDHYESPNLSIETIQRICDNKGFRFSLAGEIISGSFSSIESKNQRRTV